MDPSAIILTPVASNDTSQCAVTMTALIPPQWFADQTLIQIEYNISNDVTFTSGFISYSPGWQNAGISNQLTIGIPCTEDENIDYSGNTKVRVRAYFGSKEHSSIQVSDWSNVQPFYNSPAEAVIKHAWLSRGTTVFPPDDLLSIELNYDASYFSPQSTTTTAVKFIVSYNYLDTSGNVLWKVTELLNGTKFTLNNQDSIILDTITLFPDLDIDEPTNSVNVAVNAVYEFLDNNDELNYYSVSKISNTKQAEILNPGSVELLPILKQDYHIYDLVNPQQTITLNWEAPVVSPFLTPTKYVLLLSVDDLSFNTIDEFDPDVFTTTWAIDSSYYTSPPTRKLTFKINTYYSSEQFYVSNTESIQTFSFATQPLLLNIRYAIPTETGLTIDFNFKNPANNGQGTLPNFIYEISDLNTQEPLDHGEIDYLPNGPDNYSKIVVLDNIYSQAIRVVVFMETKNTNPFEPEYLRGASATATSLTFAPPIVESIVKNGSGANTTLVITVLSGQKLGVANQIVFKGSTILINLPFETTAPFGAFYSVNSSFNDDTSIYTYTFTFEPSFFTIGTIPNNLSVFLSNSAGIGAGTQLFV
jgi:hypothetical protein